MSEHEEEIVMRDVMETGFCVGDRIRREAASQLDLEEALEPASNHPYSTYPREWLPLIEVGGTWELPSVLIERCSTAATALCGIFTEIGLAWASTDHSIFLWRFDERDGQCLEYSLVDQAICAVGLAKCRPGVFVEAIRYLLVLATPVEVVLLGVCCSEGPTDRDSYAVQTLPGYTVSSGGVITTCIKCTNKGRIFMAGRDAHIYELLYTTRSGWHKRCHKVCLTAGVGSMISRWVVPNVFKFRAVDPVVEMVFDNERQILYARTEAMKLQAYGFGPNGEGALKKVAEERNLLRHVSQENRQSAAAPFIVSISPLSMLESKRLHLVAALSDGRRIYLSTSSSGNSGNISFSGFNNHSGTPECLDVVTTRQSPQLGVSVGLSFGAGIETAYYSAGTLVLSNSSPCPISSLLVVSRDSRMHSQAGGSSGTRLRSSRALQEVVSSLPIEGSMLFVSDLLLSPDNAAAVQSLYSELEYCGLKVSGESYTCGKLWARGDLSTQHILPRRKIVIFTSMGMMELVFNRPVDILRRLLESNSPRSLLEDFFTRFGSGESAAMCLMLAARIITFEDLVSDTVADKAAEAFEDPRIVGMPQFDGSSGLSNARITGDFISDQIGRRGKPIFPGAHVVQRAKPIFLSAQVVKDPQPILPGAYIVQKVKPIFPGAHMVQETNLMFSAAHEGLCLCTARLLFPLWELPVMSKKNTSETMSEDGVVICRLSNSAMYVLESKIRLLEKFLRSRRDQRRGLYGCVAGLGDVAGSIFYGTGSGFGATERNTVRSLFGSYANRCESANKRQSLPYSPAELAAMEARAMECIRQLLLRSAEALFLLQLISQYHVARLVQGFDANLKQALVQLTFHQLVCSEEGGQIAARLISAMMKYCSGSDGKGTVDYITSRLREGCPSYFKKSDYNLFLAIERLERADLTSDAEEKENVAREAFSLLTEVPGSADLRTVCKLFEDLRFYEAVVCLPLKKAKALDPAGNAFNDQIDASTREHALSRRKQCYEIIVDALRSLASSMLEEASHRQYICQIVHLGVQLTDGAFREYLYKAMIELGLENELLEYGGPDLVPFLQNAGSHSASEGEAISSGSSPLGTQTSSNEAKYCDLLAKYYVSKKEHLRASHVFLQLAERSVTNSLYNPTLEQRGQYFSHAVLQAKNASYSDGLVGSAQGASESGLLYQLEGKLALFQFQVKIREKLDVLTSYFKSLDLMQRSGQYGPVCDGGSSDACSVLASAAKLCNEAAMELSLELKSLTELYNEYAVPFELWEICVEMLYFANYSDDADSSIIRETWARLIDQALLQGGIAEACSVLKRVGSHIYPDDGVVLPLDVLCLQLEKAALERSQRSEYVGDEDIARALLAACKGAAETVFNAYESLLSNASIVPSPNLRIRLLRSVLVVLLEWAMSVLSDRMGPSPTRSSLILGGSFALEHKAALNQGVCDKIANAANRFMNEARRLNLPAAKTEIVYAGFKELNESLLTSFSSF